MALSFAKSAKPTIFRMRILSVTEIFLCEAYRFQKTSQTADAQKNNAQKVIFVTENFSGAVEQQIILSIYVTERPKTLQRARQKAYVIFPKFLGVFLKQLFSLRGMRADEGGKPFLKIAYVIFVILESHDFSVIYL